MTTSFRNDTGAALLQASLSRGPSRMPIITFLAGCMLALLFCAQMVVWSGPVGLAWIVAACLLLFFLSPTAAIMLLFTALLFQNVIIALIAPQIVDHIIFSILQATSFLITLIFAGFALPVWLRLHDYLKREYKPLFRSMIFLIFIIGLYSLYGLTQTNAASVATYARTFLSGCLMLIVGIVFGLQLKPRHVAHIIGVFALVLFLWGLAELLIPRELYSAINAADFLRLKFAQTTGVQAFSRVSDVLNFEQHSYLNLSGIFGLDLVTLRLRGPSLHPITFAYSAAFCSLLCFMYGEDLLALGCFVVVLLIGAKGALLLSILSVGLYLFYKATRNPGWYKCAMAIVLLGYVGLALLYGSTTQDYHFVGLMGGIKGFLHNPLGHGIGVGGNLSAEGKQDLATKITTIQNIGGDYGFESGVGVGLYQMGIGFVAIIGFFYQMWRQIWMLSIRETETPRLMVMPSLYAILLANSLFQEEAFSPVGWGVWFLFGGLLISNSWHDNGILNKTKATHDVPHPAQTR